MTVHPKTIVMSLFFEYMQEEAGFERERKKKQNPSLIILLSSLVFVFSPPQKIK
jgi:hypothetical protein